MSLLPKYALWNMMVKDISEIEKQLSEAISKVCIDSKQNPADFFKSLGAASYKTKDCLWHKVAQHFVEENALKSTLVKYGRRCRSLFKAHEINIKKQVIQNVDTKNENLTDSFEKSADSGSPVPLQRADIVSQSEHGRSDMENCETEKCLHEAVPIASQPQARPVQFLENLSPILSHSSSSDDDIVVTESAKTATSTAIAQSSTKNLKIVTANKAQAEDDSGAVGGTWGVDIDNWMKLDRGFFGCAYCLRFPKESIMLRCSHHFCYECIHKKLIEQEKNCPICSVEFEEGQLIRDNCMRFLTELYQHGGKKIFVNPVNKESMEHILHCPLCAKTLMNPMITPCGHNFCAKCIQNYLETKDYCPRCNQKINQCTYDNFELKWILLEYQKLKPEENLQGEAPADLDVDEILGFSLPISDPNEFLKIDKLIKENEEAKKIVSKFIEKHFQEFINMELFSEEIESIWRQCIGPAVASKYRLSKSKNQHLNSLILNDTDFYRCFRGVAMVKGGITEEEFFKMTRNSQLNVQREDETELEESQEEDD